MASYDFEKAAKNAVISILDEAIDISQLDIVWFASSLGYKKCTILGVLLRMFLSLGNKDTYTASFITICLLSLSNGCLIAYLSHMNGLF